MKQDPKAAAEAKEVVAQAEKLKKQQDLEKQLRELEKKRLEAEKQVKEAAALAKKAEEDKIKAEADLAAEEKKKAAMAKKVDNAAKDMSDKLVEGLKAEANPATSPQTESPAKKEADVAKKDDGLSEADKAKKEKQRPKVDAVIKKCETKKEAAAELFKLGQYGEAVKEYKKALASLESCGEDFPLFAKEVAQLEATIFNNMAVCCKKELNSKQEVEFTTKVVDRAAHIDDPSVLLKAYLRRGLAYEQMEKFFEARQDMNKVRGI